MSRKSPRIRPTQQSLSQPVPTKKSKGRAMSLSQNHIDEDFPTAETAAAALNDHVNNCVRYFVCNAGQKIYFRKAEIAKHVVPKAGQQLQQIIEKAAQILKNVYGYNLLVCDATAKSTQAYIISNSLPYVNYKLVDEKSEDRNTNKILILLILSHLFMSSVPVSEASLFSFLGNFGIESNHRHPLFGNVKEFIANTLIKQKYVDCATDPVSKKTTYSWGIRSEKEISKQEILKFACKMYGDRQPQSWINQNKDAQEQGFENNRQE